MSAHTTHGGSVRYAIILPLSLRVGGNDRDGIWMYCECLPAAQKERFYVTTHTHLYNKEVLYTRNATSGSVPVVNTRARGAYIYFALARVIQHGCSLVGPQRGLPRIVLVQRPTCASGVFIRRPSTVVNVYVCAKDIMTPLSL